MRSVKKAGFRIARWVYRSFFERRLWWFLSILKTYFLTEITQQLFDLEGRTNARLQNMEAATAAQWDSLEQLLLAILRQPAVRTISAQSSSSERTSIDDSNQLNSINESHTLR